MLAKRFLLSVLFLVAASFAHAQNVRINSVNNQDGKLIVSYTISPNIQGERYRIKLYSSHDNYAAPVQYVEGDVGDDISSSNPSKTIIWDAKKELRTYSGQLLVEVRGSVSYVPVNMARNLPDTKVGKSMPLRWNGGADSDKIKIDLYREGIYYSNIGTVDNTRIYDWFLPKSLDKGKAYQVKLTNTSKTSESFITDAFTIKGKSPVGWILLGAAAVGGGVYFILNMDTTDDPDPITETGLPDPPEAPGSN